MNAQLKQVQETRFGRLWLHLQNPDTQMAWISAYSSQRAHADNQKLGGEFEEKLKTLGYGFIPLVAAYKDRHEVLSSELSCIIFNIELSRALNLAKEYDQESILFKDEEGLRLIYANGVVGKHFGLNFSFTPEAIKEVYSAFRRGPHRYWSKSSKERRKFAFLPQEEPAPKSEPAPELELESLALATSTNVWERMAGYDPVRVFWRKSSEVSPEIKEICGG